jgi:hypothetical protein
MTETSINQKIEIWKEIPGYEGVYYASDYGRIKRLDSVITRKLPSSDFFQQSIKGRILAQNISKFGYCYVGLHRQGKRVMCSVHRLVLTAFTGIQKDGIEVNHIDGDKINNSLKNLEWVSRRDNIIHRCNVLKKAIGDEHPARKLNSTEIPIIRTYIEKGESMASIGKRFGVSQGAIIKIKHGKTWAHVE